MKDFFNYTSRNSLQPDIIFKYDDETIILCYLDASRRREYPKNTDVKTIPAWSIVKITTTEEAGVKTYERKWPNGNSRFDFAVSDIDTYNFEFAI